MVADAQVVAECLPHLDYRLPVYRWCLLGAGPSGRCGYPVPGTIPSPLPPCLQDGYLGGAGASECSGPADGGAEVLSWQHARWGRSGETGGSADQPDAAAAPGPVPPGGGQAVAAAAAVTGGAAEGGGWVEGQVCTRTCCPPWRLASSCSSCCCHWGSCRGRWVGRGASGNTGMLWL